MLKKILQKRQDSIEILQTQDTRNNIGTLNSNHSRASTQQMPIDFNKYLTDKIKMTRRPNASQNSYQDNKQIMFRNKKQNQKIINQNTPDHNLIYFQLPPNLGNS